jgi:hypothetical protein
VDKNKGNNIDFRTDKVFQIAGRTVSVDFVLKDRNIIIKYWNPVEILSLQEQPGYRKNYYEQYLASWKDFCGQYQRAGGKIHQIVSADTEVIVAKLPLANELAGEETMYALAQNEPAVSLKTTPQP